MGLLLFKFLPYIWPLLKEFLEGKKDHPYFKDGVRAKSKSKLFAFILLMLVIALGSWAYDLHKDNEELAKKLETLKAPITVSGDGRLYSREHIDLALCQKSSEDLRLQVAQNNVLVAELTASAKTCQTELGWERLNKPSAQTPTNIPTRANPVKKAPIGDDVQRQLEELRKKEGNGNAPH